MSNKVVSLMPHIKVIRPRLRQAFSYKITGEAGLYFSQPETFDTEAQAEKDAARACAAFAKLGKMPKQIMIEPRLVPAKHIEQREGVRVALVDGMVLQ